MHISETLNAAADILEQDGWKQRPLPFTAGPLCASLAIGKANTNRHAAAYDALTKYLGVEPFLGVIAWNDAPGRTAAEVVEALRACAVIEASRERQPAAVVS